MKLVAKIQVIGMPPVPWSTAEVGVRSRRDGSRYRFTTRNKALTTWQEYVKLHARDAMADRPPTTGPIFARAEFRFRCADPGWHGRILHPAVEWSDKRKKWVKKGDAIPDCDNLFKAAMDALQEIVFANDAQIAVQCSSRRHWPHDGAYLSIWEFTPGDALGKLA